jgi:hypothetical protein
MSLPYEPPTVTRLDPADARARLALLEARHAELARDLLAVATAIDLWTDDFQATKRATERKDKQP